MSNSIKHILMLKYSLPKL